MTTDCFVSLFRRPGIKRFIIFAITMWCVTCCADDQVDTIAVPVTETEGDVEEKGAIFPENYSFDIASVQTELQEDWKKFQFHGFFEVTSPLHARDEESQQSSSQFLKDNELTHWLEKQIPRKLSFDSEIEIKDGFEMYEIERCEFD